MMRCLKKVVYNLILQAQQYIKQQNYQLAEQNLKILQRQYPNRWEPIYESIRISKRQGKDYQKSLNDFESLARTFPQVGKIQYQIAKCHAKLTNLDEALIFLELSGSFDNCLDQKTKIKKYKQKIQQQEQKSKANQFREQLNLLDQCEFENYLLINKQRNLPYLPLIWLHQFKQAEQHLLQDQQNEKQKYCMITTLYLSYCYYQQKQYGQALSQIQNLNAENWYSALYLLYGILNIYLSKQCMVNQLIDQIIDLDYNFSSFMQFYKNDFHVELILSLLIQNVELFQCTDNKTKIFYEILGKLQSMSYPPEQSNFRFRLLFFQFKMLFSPDFSLKKEEQEINEIIKNTQHFAYGYYIKFYALVRDDRREQAISLLEQVTKCNDSYEKFITIAEIFVQKQEMNQALNYLHKAQQINQYDDRNLLLKAYIEQMTNQFENLKNSVCQLQKMGICIIKNSELKQYLWDYLFQFEYYKALSLIECLPQCSSYILFTSCLQALNSFYFQQSTKSNTETAFIYGQQNKDTQILQISNKHKILSQYYQILNDEDLDIDFEFQPFQQPLTSCQKELLCNQILFYKQYLNGNQLYKNMNKRYCEVLINLFKMFVLYFTVEIEDFGTQSSGLLDDQNPESISTVIPLKQWKKVCQSLIELTYQIYKNFAKVDLEKFQKEWSISLRVILKKGQTPNWTESMQNIFKKIEWEIQERIEQYDYNMKQYGEQLKLVYEEPYFFDGISKLALTDFIKILGFSSLFRDVIEAQDFEFLIADQVAHRKYEQFYEYQKKD